MGNKVFLQLSYSLLLIMVMLCAIAGNASGTQTGALTSQDLLAQAEATKTADHSQFLSVLKKLDKKRDVLSTRQQWHLSYLNAWEDVFSGNYTEAIKILDNIIENSSDMTLEVRASGLKINVLTRQKRYGKAYELANKLIADLPSITNSRARIEALGQIIQMLSFAGQYDQAQEYIKTLQSESTSNIIRCKTASYAMNAMYMASRLSSTNPQLKNAIGLCLSNKEPIFAHTLQLDKASLLIAEGHPRQAIIYLQHMAPSILEAKYQSHIVSLYSTLADAYLARKNYTKAQEEAIKAVGIDINNNSPADLEDAYRVLYEVKKKAGDSAAALAYYEKYVKLDNSSINDAKARALAYQMVKQEVLAKKLNLESVTKKNRILKLQKDLEQKATETSRLYIALLLALVALIVLWLYRIKHSQMRFRRMARHDGLTGVYNRQHFFDESKRTLKRLRKDNVSVCLVLLDLDHFKRINDTYGHAAGDEVLQNAITICRQELRTSDIVGRLGGEEFGILMPGCSREHGIEISNRIRHALASTPMKLDTGDTVIVSASFGLACSDASGHDMTQLFTDSDAALYSAKRGGRNRLIAGSTEVAENSGPDSDAVPPSSR